MPQPFENFNMGDLQNFSQQDFFRELKRPSMNNSEIHTTSKVASLAHFLVQNFRDELSSEEHVIDTAIRLLRKMLSSTPKPETKS